MHRSGTFAGFAADYDPIQPWFTSVIMVMMRHPRISRVHKTVDYISNSTIVLIIANTAALTTHPQSASKIRDQIDRAEQWLNRHKTNLCRNPHLSTELQSGDRKLSDLLRYPFNEPFHQAFNTLSSERLWTKKHDNISIRKGKLLKSLPQSAVPQLSGYIPFRTHHNS